MTTYYNENDRFAAGWLENLAKAGKIAEGRVDQRSIKDVRATDLDGVHRAHFFAGIAGWELALQLAGWPGGREVWTGSCPCQPFSIAGRRKGTADERHLWPDFRRLIAECRPPTVFGEQVGSKDGRLWLSGVRADLETLGYAVGAADLCAAGVGAPNIRQRIYWVANSEDSNRRRTTKQGNRGRRTEKTGGPSFWDRFEAVRTQKGIQRVEPGVLPVADGVPGRVGLLRGYGNAINPVLAAEFVKAFMETETC